MSITEELKEYLLGEGASDVGFFRCDDGPMQYGVSIVLRLSREIVAEINNAPTLTYFNHYRQVNAYIDRLLLQTGLFLQKRGYGYITVAASQSMNDDGWNYHGRYSHKKGACLAGLGAIGKNSMFIHSEYGSLVRLGTLFTDCPLEYNMAIAESPCGGCSACVDACPSGAITGKDYYVGIPREEIFNAEKCSTYMKKEFQKIGRGAVCGICMRVCPLNKLPERKN